MAEISSLLTLQGQLALLTLVGFFLARKGIINAQGRKCLTDLLINVILPANIIQSFLVEFSWDVLKSSASILVISLALQIGCVVLCALGYNWLRRANVLLDLEKVAIGGGISKQPILVETLNEVYEEYILRGHPFSEAQARCLPRPEIVPCRFLSEANQIGAFASYQKAFLEN